MIRPAVESAVPAENASRFPQSLGKPSGFPTAPTATTTTGYSWCPSNRGKSAIPQQLPPTLRDAFQLGFHTKALQLEIKRSASVHRSMVTQPMTSRVRYRSATASLVS